MFMVNIFTKSSVNGQWTAISHQHLQELQRALALQAKLVVRNCWHLWISWAQASPFWARSVARLEAAFMIFICEANILCPAGIPMKFSRNSTWDGDATWGCFFHGATPGIFGRSKKRVRGRRKHGGTGRWKCFVFRMDQLSKNFGWWKKSYTLED